MKSGMKLIAALLITIAINGCINLMFITRHHSYIDDKEIINGELNFTYNAGVHLIEKIMKENNINREEATIKLLNMEILKENICSSGYQIKREVITRNGDVVIYLKCGVTNNEDT